MLKLLKSVAELGGIVPALLGFFKIAPQFFAPSPFYEPDILYAAGGLSVLAFLSTEVYLRKIDGPISQWTKATQQTYFKRALLGFGSGVVSAAVYLAVVQMFPYASGPVTFIQFATWAGFFACWAFGVTALAIIWQSGPPDGKTE